MSRRKSFAGFLGIPRNWTAARCSWLAVADELHNQATKAWMCTLSAASPTGTRRLGGVQVAVASSIRRMARQAELAAKDALAAHRERATGPVPRTGHVGRQRPRTLSIRRVRAGG